MLSVSPAPGEFPGVLTALKVSFPEWLSYFTWVTEHGCLQGRITGRSSLIFLGNIRLWEEYLTPCDPLVSSDSCRHGLARTVVTPAIRHGRLEAQPPHQALWGAKKAELVSYLEV